MLFVDEVSSGIGGICGSVTLNMRFREFLMKKLGSEIPPDALDEVDPLCLARNLQLTTLRL
jgi:hypothetical protein